MSEFRAIGKDEKPSIADVPIYRGTDDVVSDLQVQLATQQATIDRLTAQLALAVEALREAAPTCPWCSEGLPIVDFNGTGYHQNAEGKLGTCYRGERLRAAINPTDPDIDAAVQAMQAGRRVLDREWLIGYLIDANDESQLVWTPRGIADCIIDKLKEAQ